jgi:hypothetical protein
MVFEFWIGVNDPGDFIEGGELGWADASGSVSGAGDLEFGVLDEMVGDGDFELLVLEGVVEGLGAVELADVEGSVLKDFADGEFDCGIAPFGEDGCHPGIDDLTRARGLGWQRLERCKNVVLELWGGKGLIGIADVGEVHRLVEGDIDKEAITSLLIVLDQSQVLT